MENSNQIILVTGATGNQGGAVARHLLQRDKFKVRAMVRDQNKPAAQSLKQAGAELVIGDFNDRASFDRALQGVYGVFSIQDFRDGVDTEIRQGIAIADAAKAASIEHFVYSSVGTLSATQAFHISTASFKSKNMFERLSYPTQSCVQCSSFTITTGCDRWWKTERCSSP
jgi:uncharacterized protein YbjT (DUF2867 family)